jgi:hypothetical protein
LYAVSDAGGGGGGGGGGGSSGGGGGTGRRPLAYGIVGVASPRRDKGINDMRPSTLETWPK